MVALVASTSGFVSAADDVPKFEVPVQKIEGGDKPIQLGEPVTLNVSKVVTPPKNFVSYTVEWKVFDGGFEKKFYKNEDGIYFGSGTTKRKVIVFASVSYLYVVKDGDKFVEAGVKSQFLSITVDIGKDEDNVVPPTPPGPNPNPPTPPTPEPTFEDGQFKLAAKAYKIANDKVVGDRKAAATALSKVFSGKAAKLAGLNPGVMTAGDIKKFLEETTADNKAALTAIKVSPDVWDSFGTALQEEIYGLYSSDKLKTGADFSAAWREIASGLSAVK